MKDEIKEKLDNLRIYAGREENGFICDIEDYITNLQEENEQLKKCNKESIKFLNQDDIRDIIIKKDYNIFNLQQRIYKAIEILEHDMENIDLEDGYRTCEQVLNILQGSDKDV